MVQRISSPVFIGREAELRCVAELRARVIASGQGETILITGEAGIGKTRFLREIASRAAADGWLVLSGACDEFGATARPFSALAEMVSTVDSFLVAEAPGELERPAWLAIQALATGAAAPADTGSVVQLALDLFRRVSAIRPLLVVVDDLHWADESLRGLFGMLARGLAGSPAVVVGAYRENEVDRAHPLRPVLAAVHRNVAPEVIPLPPLAVEEAGQLARAVGAGVGDLELAALHERSGGNTFLIEELLAAPPGEIPLGAREVVLARLHGFSAEAVALAELAALDTSFDQAVLSQAGELDRTVFTEAFDALVGSQLVVQDGEWFAYRHALIREVIAESVPPARKAGMHARLALAIEAHHPAQAGTIARHWLESGDKEKALVAAVGAARYSFSLGAMPESADWYETALSLWSDVPNARTVVGRSVAQITLLTDFALAGCRRFDRCIELLQQRLARPQEATAADRADMWLRLSYRAWQASGNEEVTLPLSVTAFCKASETLDEEMDPSDRVRLVSSYILHGVHRYGMDEEAALAFSSIEPLLAAYGGSLAAKKAAKRHIMISEGDAELVELVSQDSAALRPGVQTEHNESVILSAFGAHELNIQRSLVRLANITEYGQEALVGFAVEAHLGVSLIALGCWRESLERWEATKANLPAEVVRDWATLVVQGWAILLVRTGRIEEAREFVDLAARETIPYSMQPYLGPVALSRVELARCDGNGAAAVAAVDDSLVRVRGHHAALLGEPIAYAIGHLADGGDPRRPDQESLTTIDRWFERIDSCLEYAPGRINLYDSGVFLAQAEAERARLLGDDCVETWEDLALRWHDLSRPYHEAYCRYRAASALLIAPPAAERKLSRERASGHLEEALAITSELGAVYLEADVRELQKVAGLRMRPKPTDSAPAPAANGHPQLTSRELEVLRLLVAGESNGQIAIRLGITTKTASVHVSNILRKLEVDNRVEAAVRASRIGLAI